MSFYSDGSSAGIFKSHWGIQLGTLLFTNPQDHAGPLGDTKQFIYNRFCGDDTARLQQRLQFRSLFRRRNDLVKNIRRIKCSIKSMLLHYGITLPEKYDTIAWSKEMLQWLGQ